MHYPLLMTAVSASEGFTPFVQRLENSGWLQYYMFYIRKMILNGNNYQLGTASLRFMMHLMGTNLQIWLAQMALLGYPPASFGG